MKDNHFSPLTIGFAVCLSLLWSSCSSAERAANPPADSAMLQRQLRTAKNDPTLQRDLGIAYFQEGRLELARLYLNRSFTLIPSDARTVFFLGMAFESLGDVQSAFATYSGFESLPSSPFLKLIEGRFLTVQRAAFRQQLQALLYDERKLGVAQQLPKAVAVFPLNYQGTDQKYAPLSKGLSELLLVDLAQITRLKLVERVRVEALLDELKLGQSKKVDLSSAPRLGKLVSAGRIVSGAFDVRNDKLRMDVAAWDVIAKKFPDLKSESDDIDNLFKVEKTLVFQILNDLGVTPTPEERAKIEFIPTRNILALLNYSLGLQSEDASDFNSAKIYYAQAASLDQNFTRAAGKAASADSYLLAGGAMENAMRAAEQIDPQLKRSKKKKGTDIVVDRLQNLGRGIGSTFTPGQDDRKPVEEAIDFGLLPEPPKPRGK